LEVDAKRRSLNSRWCNRMILLCHKSCWSINWRKNIALYSLGFSIYSYGYGKLPHLWIFLEEFQVFNNTHWFGRICNQINQLSFLKLTLTHSWHPGQMIHTCRL
jgi:hypothetical protein